MKSVATAFGPIPHSHGFEKEDLHHQVRPDLLLTTHTATHMVRFSLICKFILLIEHFLFAWLFFGFGVFFFQVLHLINVYYPFVNVESGMKFKSSLTNMIVSATNIATSRWAMFEPSQVTGKKISCIVENVLINLAT